MAPVVQNFATILCKEDCILFSIYSFLQNIVTKIFEWESILLLPAYVGLSDKSSNHSRALLLCRIHDQFMVSSRPVLSFHWHRVDKRLEKARSFSSNRAKTSTYCSMYYVSLETLLRRY